MYLIRSKVMFRLTRGGIVQELQIDKIEGVRKLRTGGYKVQTGGDA